MHKVCESDAAAKWLASPALDFLTLGDGENPADQSRGRSESDGFGFLHFFIGE